VHCVHAPRVRRSSPTLDLMALKRQFGSRLSRLLNGGATLSSVEYALLDAAVTALPQELRSIVVAQFGAYNLVQREVDGRALNFYRKGPGAAKSEELPVLPLKEQEAPLIRLSARIEGSPAPVHAVLTAVAGRAFSLTIDRALGLRERERAVKIERVVNAWRANLAPHTEV
jgi:hypothetical protein